MMWSDDKAQLVSRINKIQDSLATVSTNNSDIAILKNCVEDLSEIVKETVFAVPTYESQNDE